MEIKEREYIKFRFGLCLNTILQERKEIADRTESKDVKAIISLRKLEAASGIRFATLQEISVGKKNPSCTTIVAIAEGLNLTLTELWSRYESIPHDEVLKFKRSIEANKKIKNTKKKA